VTYVASGSRLPLLDACPASCALPQFPSRNEEADLGNAIHEHLAERVGLGISLAVERLDLIAAKWQLNEKLTGIFRARCISFEWTPPRGAVPEFALGLFEDGSVKQITGGRGKYPSLQGLILPLTLDIMWAEPTPLYRTADGIVRCPTGSILHVGDYKSGKDKYVSSVETNMQAIAQAVLAARWTGATHALPAIIFVRKGPGLWDVPAAPLGPAELDAAEAHIRALLSAGAAQQAAYAAGDPLSYRTGPHCLYCDAGPGCTAKLAPIKTLLGDRAPLEPGPLTRPQAALLAVLEPQLRQLADQAKAALLADVQASGESIPLGSGRAWGGYLETEDVLIADKVLPVLEEEVGPELAQAAVRMKITKTAMGDAIKASHEAQGIERQKAAAMRRVLARSREAGGIETRTRIRYGLHAAQDTPTHHQLAAARYDEVDIDGDP
jgi:hypothetical protein